MCHNLRSDLGTLGWWWSANGASMVKGHRPNDVVPELYVSNVDEQMDTPYIKEHPDVVDHRRASKAPIMDQVQASAVDSGCTRPQNEVQALALYLLVPRSRNVPFAQTCSHNPDLS